MVDIQTALLQGLDKVTARVSPIRAALGIPTLFRHARDRRPQLSRDAADRAAGERRVPRDPGAAAGLGCRRAPVDLFSGWMFASSPAVSALEHPVYDVWVIDCDEPVAPPTVDGETSEDGSP